MKNILRYLALQKATSNDGKMKYIFLLNFSDEVYYPHKYPLVPIVLTTNMAKRVVSIYF